MVDWAKKRDRAVAKMMHEQTHGENERRIAELEAEITTLRKTLALWSEFAKRTLDDLPKNIRRDPGTPIYAWGKITEAGCFEIYVGDFEKMAALTDYQEGK